MNSHKGEPSKITGEIPVSLNLLSVVNRISVSYMKVKGFAYILLGFAWYFFISPSENGVEWTAFLTPTIVGILWVVSGAVALWSGLRKSHKAKRLGFFALIMVPAILGSYTLFSWIIYLFSSTPERGTEGGLVITISYWAFSASAYLMARIYTYTFIGSDIPPRGAIK